MQRTPKHRATEKTKIVTVATGKGVKIFLVISLFVYAVISAWLIVHYSLSLKGIVLLLPGFIILSLLLYDVLVWKIKASKDGIFLCSHLPELLQQNGKIWRKFTPPIPIPIMRQ